MECTLCKTGILAPGQKTLTFEKGPSIVLIKDVPGMICGSCGHFYTDSSQTTKVLQQAAEGLAHHAELEVLRFVA